MALIDDVKTILNRLAPLGWKDLLAKHGLDITKTDLDIELTRSLAMIKRDLPGFETFTKSGIKAIESGSPTKCQSQSKSNIKGVGLYLYFCQWTEPYRWNAYKRSAHQKKKPVYPTL
jgi:hypothetical protein